MKKYFAWKEKSTSFGDGGGAEFWCGRRFSSTYNVLDPSMEQPTHIKYLHPKNGQHLTTK